MELKKITPEQAFTALREGKKVYAIREVDLSITLTDLLTENLAVEVEESVAPNKPESGGEFPEETGLGNDCGIA